uniref:Uncharacterized protein n=1 Tax=Trichogramma kaykai TaxID=54128 RepID=A0ABD2WKU3_9HYME
MCSFRYTYMYWIKRIPYKVGGTSTSSSASGKRQQQQRRVIRSSTTIRLWVHVKMKKQQQQAATVAAQGEKSFALFVAACVRELSLPVIDDTRARYAHCSNGPVAKIDILQQRRRRWQWRQQQQLTSSRERDRYCYDEEEKSLISMYKYESCAVHGAASIVKIRVDAIHQVARNRAMHTFAIKELLMIPRNSNEYIAHRTIGTGSKTYDSDLAENICTQDYIIQSNHRRQI